MRNFFLMSTILFLITACTSTTKPMPKVKVKSKASLSYVTIDKNDSKEMKSLKVALSEYTEATINNDVEKLVSFVYPKTFQIISKESMLKTLKKAHATGKIPSVKNIKHLTINPIKSYDKGFYSIITSSMTTVLNSPQVGNEAFEDYMLDMLQHKFASKGTVTLDKKKHQFNIQHKNKTIALNENNSWKFIGLKKVKQYIKRGIFPKTLIEKIQ